MPTSRFLLAVAATGALLAPPGCEKLNEFWSGKRSPAGSAGKSKPQTVPPHIAGTVAEYARLVGGGDLVVQGYGVVVGLGTNGSREVPAHLRGYLSKQLGKHYLGSYRRGTKGLSPLRFLRDADTAIVLVAGVIPPGAPEGTPFDVAVSALGQTSTRSLDGGMLMPLDLHLAVGGLAVPGGPSKPLASAAGEVFVNPYLNPQNTAELARYRRGRVLNGGKVVQPRRLLLRLKRADYSLCDTIQRRINGRFPSSRMRVANARNRQVIAIHIPPSYRDDYGHFLRLLLHLPVRSGPTGGEAQARRIAKAMELPGARHEELALVWEAAGRQVIPVVRPLYASRNRLASYYAARTGLRLGDDLAEEVVLRFAQTPRSPLQIPAVRELGRHRKVVRAVPILERLLHDRNERLRIAAYESLLQRGDSPTISRIRVQDKFDLDLVDSRRDYVIYATQSGAPRIVLFGRNMTVNRPVFFLAPGELVTINANREGDDLTVRRKVPRSGSVSDPARVEPYARALIQVLGGRPHVLATQPASAPASPPTTRGPVATGLGLTYGQVVCVLQHLCKQKDIHAQFVLQEGGDLSRLYDVTVTSGRPDMPG